MKRRAAGADRPNSIDDDYWDRSRRPCQSLWFVLPFLLMYEVGVRTSTPVPGGVRSGADVWIRQAILEAGWTVDWIFPILVPLILLGWHVWRRDRWSCHWETLSGMFAESLLFALLLVLLGQMAHAAFTAGTPWLLATGRMHRAVSFLGAGIYEELLFRLMLLPVMYGGCRLVLMPRWLSACGAMIGSSLLFATAHYVETAAFLSPIEIATTLNRVLETPELWYSFTFRFLAGITFSWLFWYRGFGVAAGCHMLYDLIVGVLLASVAAR